MLSTILQVLNRLLPFATPGTPLLQDTIHLAAICAILYFAPQLQDWLQTRREDGQPNDQAIDEQINDPHPGADFEAEDVEVIDESVRDNVQNAQHEVQIPDAPQHGHAVPPAADQIDPDVAQPAPAYAAAPSAGARNVGAKKAKSLARKDQKRAYHEFQRSQGEAQRAHDAEGAAEREAVLAAERQRRSEMEEKFEMKKAREREVKREAEKREREQEVTRRERAVAMVRRELEEASMCDLWKVAKVLGGDVDEEWVERVLSAAEVAGRKGAVVTMITRMGWAVRVREADMMAVYEQAVKKERHEDDKVGYGELGAMLETVIRTQSHAAA